MDMAASTGMKWWLVLCFFQSALAEDLYIWHITDLHLDPTYETTQGSCNHKIDKPGIFGSYECDSTYKLMESSFQAMKEHGANPAFIIHTGDTVYHAKDYTNFNADVILSYLRNVTDLLKSTFPNIPVVQAIGNHDYFPVNQLPGSENKVYQGLAEMSEEWLGGDDAMATFKKGAYYTRLLHPEHKLRIVVLNTNLYLVNNEMTASEDDPGHQYAWLDQVLSDARANSEKVHIIGHVPPGVMPENPVSKSFRDKDNTRFEQIMRNFSDVIVVFYSSHEHFDTFRVYYDGDGGEPIGIMLVAPSVTPWRHRSSSAREKAPAHNPAVRKIYFDSTQRHLTDVEQFYLDLPNANNIHDAEWVKLYSYREAYNLPDVSVKSLHDLSVSFNEDSGEDAFNRYYAYNSVNSKHVSVPHCGCGCRSRHYCSIRYITYDEYDMCDEQSVCKSGVDDSGAMARDISLYLLLTTIIGTVFSLL